MKRLMQCIILILMLLIVVDCYIDFKFNKSKIKFNPSSEINAIWSHRGVHNNFQENSIAAIQLAKDQYFKGVEIDVFYDDIKGFVVSHDEPYKLIDGEILLLEEVFKEFGTALYYWIDLKNLTKKNKGKVTDKLKKYFSQYPSLSEKVYIESDNGWALRKLSKEDINCNYWVQFSRKQPKQFLKILYLKFIIGHSNFTGITTDSRYIDTVFIEAFEDFRWFIFTVNDKKLINELLEFKETTVILTDLEGKDVFEK